MENNELPLPPTDDTKQESTNSSPIENGLIGRNPKGQFLPGSIPNPNGRPAGSRNRACLLARALLEEKAAALTAKVLEEALNGNPIAYKLCIERLVPIPNDAPVDFPLPDVGAKANKDTPDRLFESHNALLQSVASGAITPHEAQLVSQLLEARRRTWDALEAQHRLEAVDKRLSDYESRNGRKRRS